MKINVLSMNYTQQLEKLVFGVTGQDGLDAILNAAAADFRRFFRLTAGRDERPLGWLRARIDYGRIFRWPLQGLGI